MAYDRLDPFIRDRVFVQTGSAGLAELDGWEQITEEEVALVSEMTRRNELSGGTPVVRDFEQAWREWIGSKYALTVMNGTSALYSAYFGLGVGPGDEVICPVNTWICSIAPAILLGARPVFCDIDPDTLMIDPEDLRRRITVRTRCICAVHMWGNVCDLEAVMGIGREYGIAVVEDCSHAHGARYRGRMCGGIGEAGCWSLQGSKAVSAGEGGVMTTDDVDVFERACLVGQVNRIKGVDLVCEKYAALQPLGLGMKFRAHPLGIGIAKVQLGKLAELNRRRGAYIAEVEARLAEIPGFRPITVYEGVERGGYYGFPAIYEPARASAPSMEELILEVGRRGIGLTVSPYPNLHDLPLFRDGFDVFTRNRGPLCASAGYRGYRPGDFPKAELAQRRTVFLPRLSHARPDAAGRVLAVLGEVVGGKGGR